MHESVVTLQEFIATDRAAASAMTKALRQSQTRRVVLINHVYLEEEVRLRTKRADDLEQLVNAYDNAARNRRPAETAHKLVLIQFAAATLVEVAKIKELHGLG